MATHELSRFLHRLKRQMAAETLRDQSDQLVARFLACQDEAVFEVLLRRHGPMVYRVCWRVLQHSQDTEDVFQVVFLLLARKLRTVRNRDSLASWLHGVAHRAALKARAQAARRRQREERVCASGPAVPPDETTWRELRAVLDAELNQLPEKWRLPLILHYLEGRTQDETARHLGWSKSTLVRRLGEARAALRRRLTRSGIVWPAAFSALLVSECATPAAVPPELVGSTVDAVAGTTAGKAAAAGLVSAKVLALPKEH
jgi:RNA polymerase sigma factor (sigma-70 family)